MPDPELRALRQRQMIEAFTRRHTPQKARKNLTYEEQLGATSKTENQAPLFAPEDDEMEEVAPKSDDDDMVEVVGETLRNPFDDEAVARNLQEQEFAEPSAPVVPDISEQMALEASRREAARKRDEEDLALIRALQASRTDARLQFDAGEKEPSIAATRTTASMVGDSDEDDFEEVEVPHTRATTIDVPGTTPSTPDQQYFDLPLSSEPIAEDEAPPLDTGDRLLIAAAIQKDLQKQKDEEDQIQRTESPVSIDEVDTPRKPVEMKVTDYGAEAAQQTPNPPNRPPTSKPRRPSSKNADIPPTPAAVNIKPQTMTSTKFTTQDQPIDLLEQNFFGPSSEKGSTEETSQAIALESPQATNAPDQSIPDQTEISMNGLLGNQGEPSPILAAPSPPISPAPRGPVPRDSPLREMRENGNDNFSGSEDDDLDDSRSLEWSLSPEPEARRMQTDMFPPPPPELEEDEGGVDMNAEGDDYARFLASIKHRNLEQVRQEIDNEIRNLNQQNKVAMRDSEEITHQMVAQIQVSRSGSCQKAMLIKTALAHVTTFWHTLHNSPHGS